MGRSKQISPINPYKMEENRLKKIINEHDPEEKDQQKIMAYELSKVSLSEVTKRKEEYNKNIWRRFQNHGKRMVGRKKGRTAKL